MKSPIESKWSGEIADLLLWFAAFRRRRWLGLLLISFNLLCAAASAQSNYAEAYTFSTLAGLPSTGTADGVGTTAQFQYPDDAALDFAGNLYVADTLNHTIRKITSAGIVSTIAGFPGFAGSVDGVGRAARFSFPKGVAVDAAGNLYIADTGNHTIRLITPAGAVTTIAGTPGLAGVNDDIGAAARFNAPERLALDTAGNIYVADTGNFTIRKMARSGMNWVVTTIAGAAGQSGNVDAAGASARFFHPRGIAVANATNLFLVDSDNSTIRRLTLTGTTWAVTTIAGQGGPFGFVDGPGEIARFSDPRGIAIDGAGNLYVTDSNNNLIRILTRTATNWVVSTWAGRFGTFGNANGTGTNAVFYEPRGISADAGGNLYVTDVFGSAIRSITSAALVNNFAGAVSSSGFADGTGRDARFTFPYGAAVDKWGFVYVADSKNHLIRKISPAGLVVRLAGFLNSPGSADGVGNNARFNFPQGVAVDEQGVVFVADTLNQTIRTVTPSGIVRTIAGSAQNAGTNDDVGAAARFNNPHTVALDTNGNVYVADTDNHTIRKMALMGTNWTVSTIAGNPGTAGTNDGPGNVAKFNRPIGITVDRQGNVYVSDFVSHTIRRIMPAGPNWVVSTIAGVGQLNGSADGTNNGARFFGPFGISVDSGGALYVADGNNSSIRKMISANGNWIVSTIGGTTNTGSADGAGKAAAFAFPAQIAVDDAGTLYVADTGNNTIRKGVFSAFAPTAPVTNPAPTASAQLTVKLFPSNANGQWRFPWEVRWRDGGTTATNLIAGNYPVEFRPLPGWLAIPSSTTIAVSNNAALALTNQYYPTIGTVNTNAGGSLTINIGPSPPPGVGWRFLGNTTPYFPAGFSTNLLAGTYLIEFAPVSGYVRPPNLAVQLLPGASVVLFENYLLASPPPNGVLLPSPVPTNQIPDVGNYPFGFNGQLQSDVGSGSGVAVQNNVVLTVAHQVFNDQTLSYVSHAYWYFQREAGVIEPRPLEARGWYVLSGYASQRTNDVLGGLGPESSSPQSRNMDVAALYFQSPVAGGGYGGYLPSDQVPNPWLTGTSLKMLVGYPVDGSLFGDATIVPGKMYQTEPQPYPLAVATDPVANQQVYIAPWFLSYPGNSGGPVYAQFNGNFYPAGIYLGTLFNGVQPYASAVRAIDSNVVNVITLAATRGDSGTNNTGGGVITIIPGANVSAANPAYLQIALAPAGAVRAGAAWRLGGDATYSTASNYTRLLTTTSNVLLDFKPIDGWNLPTNQTLTIFPNPNAPTVVTGFYNVTNPLMVLNRAVGIGITGTTGTTYRIEQRSSLASGTWLSLRTNTILSNGFNLVLPPTNRPTTFYRLQWLPNL